MATYDIYKDALKGTEYTSVLDSTHIPFSSSFGSLSLPCDIGHLSCMNRFCAQPMEGQDGSDGAPTDLTYHRYEELAKGGWGIIWLEAVAVCPEGRSNPRQLMINGENVYKFASLAKRIRESAINSVGYAPVIILQLTHSGKFSKPEGVSCPVGLDDSEYLSRLPGLYKRAAKLALDAGFDGVDVKCCHGYLLSQAYSLGNTALLLDCARAVAELNRGILACRINAYDKYGSNGANIARADEVISSLEEMGYSLFNITAGSPYINPDVSRPYRVGLQKPCENSLDRLSDMLSACKELKMRHTGSRFVCTGLSLLGANAPYGASGCVDEEVCDIAGFGRMSFAYPALPRDVIGGMFDEKKVCIACSGCSELKKNLLHSGCMIRNPYYKEVFRKWKAQ